MNFYDALMCTYAYICVHMRNAIIYGDVINKNFNVISLSTSTIKTGDILAQRCKFHWPFVDLCRAVDGCARIISNKRNGTLSS